MGMGDDIIATGDARESFRKFYMPCVFGNGRQIHYNAAIFADNPRILTAAQATQYAKEGKPFKWVANYPGNRPYIKEITRLAFHYNEDYRVKPGELFFSKKKMMDKPYVVIEPNVNGDWAFSKNKDWGFMHWENLIKALPDVHFVQLAYGNVSRLKGENVTIVESSSFRQAFTWVADCQFVVTTDGAYHHLAAAVGKKAAVLWSPAATSPKCMGYDFHKNIGPKDRVCGTHKEVCSHCRRAMKKITEEEVIEAIKEWL